MIKVALLTDLTLKQLFFTPVHCGVFVCIKVKGRRRRINTILLVCTLTAGGIQSIDFALHL